MKTMKNENDTIRPSHFFKSQGLRSGICKSYRFKGLVNQLMVFNCVRRTTVPFQFMAFKTVMGSSDILRRIENQYTLVKSISLQAFVLLAAFVFSSYGQASFYPVEGRILDENNEPLPEGDIDIQLEVLSPNGDCILYRESHINSRVFFGGVFYAPLGGASATVSLGAGQLNNIMSSAPLNHAGEREDGSSCDFNGATGNQTRQLRVSYRLQGTTNFVTMDEGIPLGTVPFANDSVRLGGYQPSNFVMNSLVGSPPNGSYTQERLATLLRVLAEGPNNGVLQIDTSIPDGLKAVPYTSAGIQSIGIQNQNTFGESPLFLGGTSENPKLEFKVNSDFTITSGELALQGGRGPTAVVAGAGLSGGGNSGSVTLSVSPGGITNTMLSGGVTNDKIVNLNASKLTGTLNTARIAAQSITSDKLSPGIDASLITAGSLSGDRIADGSITNQKIGDVSAGKITGIIANNQLNTGSGPNQVPVLDSESDLEIDGSLIYGGAIRQTPVPVGEIPVGNRTISFPGDNFKRLLCSTPGSFNILLDGIEDGGSYTVFLRTDTGGTGNCAFNFTKSGGGTLYSRQTGPASAADLHTSDGDMDVIQIYGIGGGDGVVVAHEIKF